MPKKPSPSPIASSTAQKKSSSTPPAKKAATDDVELDDEDIDPEDLEDVLDEDEEVEGVDKEVAAVIAAVEDPDKAEDKEEEEETVDEEAILAKGDDLEILNLLAKKANRLEQGLDDDELIPDEEGMGGF